MLFEKVKKLKER